MEFDIKEDENNAVAIGTITNENKEYQFRFELINMNSFWKISEIEVSENN